ncbi:aldehyde dehydrogenase family protein [Mycobacterium sp. ITM-2016-00317]|uniref:aldehyde dehydrogenase family protein n=1 Tax=Mycobacterium sp. ITM-2016-00317 TaxID=2099694 RepID=UPI000D40BA40|nr:aldehyde dehydrogenase family protein [Mycobacterium sp. ITM-2016-00317]WNG87530.1 aldehyde dehydrogenase family protein [Mycobacterium sp. ITM-2016-00317]
MTKLTYANMYSDGLQDEEIRARFESELAAVRAQVPRICPHRIGVDAIEAGTASMRRDPTDRSRVVATFGSADATVIDKAVTEARRALPAWRALAHEQRATIIEALIPILLERREEIAALVAYELGKAQGDAITEVTECVDVIEVSLKDYRDADGFTKPLQAPAGAQWSGVVFRPYGVFAAIAPFNFPVAIPFTMLVSALLTGNTVVFKPSGLTPACGDLVYSLFKDAGVPDGVLNLIQGDGETGALLAKSNIDGVVFTGSAQVGLNLVDELSKPPFVRPVIAEMGGKNPAVISDATADVAAAARAVARSAFGMTGQKCTACSRAIVVDAVYDEFVEALAAEVAAFPYGDPADPASIGGPLVNEHSVDRFERVIAAARDDGRIVVGGNVNCAVGNFVDATVIDGLPTGHPLTREELFLPVLTVTKVPDIDAAITEANAIPFGLSAGIFTDDEQERERFLDEIEAGIVFVNHKGGATTGVWPGNQTMSGWKASGTTGKGGFGPYYLQQFVREQSRTLF